LTIIRYQGIEAVNERDVKQAQQQLEQQMQKAKKAGAGGAASHPLSRSSTLTVIEQRRLTAAVSAAGPGTGSGSGSPSPGSAAGGSGAPAHSLSADLPFQHQHTHLQTRLSLFAVHLRQLRDVRVLVASSVQSASLLLPLVALLTIGSTLCCLWNVRDCQVVTDLDTAVGDLKRAIRLAMSTLRASFA
jgi:hypothetical protein